LSCIPEIIKTVASSWHQHFELSKRRGNHTFSDKMKSFYIFGLSLNVILSLQVGTTVFELVIRFINNKTAKQNRLLLPKTSVRTETFAARYQDMADGMDRKQLLHKRVEIWAMIISTRRIIAKLQ
jgi:hypothetical protein